MRFQFVDLLAKKTHFRESQVITRVANVINNFLR